MERSDKLKEYAAEAVSVQEADAMAVPLTELMDSPGWEVLQDLLQRLRIQARESFESAADMTEVAYTKGLVTGLLLASKLPAQVLRMAERQIQREDAAKAHRTHVGRVMGRQVLSPGGDDSF